MYELIFFKLTIIIKFELKLNTIIFFLDFSLNNIIYLYRKQQQIINLLKTQKLSDLHKF